MCWTPRASRSLTSRLAMKSFMVVPRSDETAGALSALWVERSATRTAVGIWNLFRHRSFDPSLLLLLLPRMREDADRSRQHEQAATQRRWKSQLRENHRRDA